MGSDTDRKPLYDESSGEQLGFGYDIDSPDDVVATYIDTEHRGEGDVVVVEYPEEYVLLEVPVSPVRQAGVRNGRLVVLGEVLEEDD